MSGYTITECGRWVALDGPQGRIAYRSHPNPPPGWVCAVSSDMRAIAVRIQAARQGEICTERP